MTHLLFSYGTLRQPEVQLSLYGRQLQTTDDALVGYRLEWLEITDPAVIATSGSNRHPILRKGDAADRVQGARLELTDAELVATDEYEVADYVRVEAPLESGLSGWVYVAGSV